MNFDFPQWDKKHQFEGFRFSELLSSGRITALHKYSKNSREFNRHRYNNMDGETQRRWDEEFYKPKVEYGFSLDGKESWYTFPKSVFEMVVGKFPGLIIKERSFYQHRI